MANLSCVPELGTRFEERFAGTSHFDETIGHLAAWRKKGLGSRVLPLNFPQTTAAALI